MRVLLLTLMISALGAPLALAQSNPPPMPQPAAAASDPFIWLEDANSPRALDWAKAENTRSLGVLEADPRYATLHAQALKIVDATDRIPMPSFRAGRIYNFWQDETHVQGLWRRTTLASYQTSNPAWETVLDFDALSKAEGKTWVYKGANCLEPEQKLCLINLSNGGEDAVEVREFDLPAASFVKAGFFLPRGKQDVTWMDADTLAVSRDWGPGTMTESGYPFVVKLLKRGQPLDAAQEVFRGNSKDVEVAPLSVYDAQTGQRVVMINRGISFFESETYVLTPKGVVKLPLPLKTTVQGLNGGQLLFTVQQDWTPQPGGKTIGQGALVAADLNELERGGTSSATVIMAPGPRESIEEVALAKDRVVVAAYENVKGRALVFRRQPDGTWSRQAMALPDKASVSIVDADDRSDEAFIRVESFLDPTTLYLADAATGEARPIKSLPPRFDASKDVVEQFEATSTDGTKIPYFVVRPKDLKFDGNNPTILYAYGGFQVSMLPSYSASIGKLWLERGGVYVLANIRGGGEFGPSWHDAGLKTHRQRIYDDFAAVAKDLIARKITNPRRLGIQGGSNGGLLMGVEFTQHPELWRAVDIQVPLLDMIRFTQIGAGASWVGEYGSPDIPAERAFLESISPYHNLKAGVHYPEPL
ncbi:MAG TPA: prolyl oligopeptidase family serine peptidase, partial [Caulobacteraceae bacterium]|nr:prolyl oligopeptidase family serine peptidase [Caulobacteraceae bacterium]